MKLNKRKSEFGSEVIDCPFCEYWSYLRERRSNPDPTTGIKRHIVNQAKNECFEIFMGRKVETKHLDYFKQHATNKKIILTSNLVFDNDLTI
jgi:hypothetical protein